MYYPIQKKAQSLYHSFTDGMVPGQDSLIFDDEAEDRHASFITDQMLDD